MTDDDATGATTTTRSKGRTKPRRRRATSTTTVGALRPDQQNRRTHGPRNVEMIAASLRTVGAARSIVIDEANNVLAGNGVLAGATAAGISRVHVVDVDGTTLVAVRRRGLTLDQKRELAMYDNRAGELAAWNLPQLQADLLDGADALRPFFTDEELHRVLKTGATTGDGSSQIGEMAYRVVVDCTDEQHQAQMLARLEGEGLTCRALIS